MPMRSITSTANARMAHLNEIHEIQWISTCHDLPRSPGRAVVDELVVKELAQQTLVQHRQRDKGLQPAEELAHRALVRESSHLVMVQISRFKEADESLAASSHVMHIIQL